MTGENEPSSQLADATGDLEPAGDLSTEQVADYLLANPDFFVQRPELLRGMTAPPRWNNDAVVVDMHRHMVESLRGEIAGLRDCANEVIETSRANLVTQTRTHAAVVALVAANDLDQLLRTIHDDLPILLDIDVAVLCVEPAAGLQPLVSGLARLRSGIVDRFIGAGRDVALYREMADDGEVFGAAAGLVRSAALARLSCGEPAPVGMLGFGCRRDGAFHPGQGTELLRFLAKVVEVCLVRLLPVRA